MSTVSADRLSEYIRGSREDSPSVATCAAAAATLVVSFSVESTIGHASFVPCFSCNNSSETLLFSFSFSLPY